MTPDEFNSQETTRFFAAGDWGALLRFWIARQYAPALDAAIQMVENSPPCPELLPFLHAVKADPIQPKEAAPWMSRFSLAETCALQGCVSFGFMALCELGNQFPFEMQTDVYRMGIEATGALRTISMEIGDQCLAAFACGLIASGFRGLGDLNQAARAAEEAVTIRRELVKANRAAYLPDLAMSLNNVANRLSEVGRREEALTAAEEAVTIRRELVKANRAAYLPDLAGSLNTVANRLSEVGRREEALGAWREAVENFEQATTYHGKPALAENLMKCNRALGAALRAMADAEGSADYRGARDAYRKAVDAAEWFRGTWRSSDHRDRTLREAMSAYHGLVQCCVDVADTTDDPAEAIAALQEAVAVAESCRARQLRDLLAGELVVPVGTPPVMAKAFAELRRRLLQTEWDWDGGRRATVPMPEALLPGERGGTFGKPGAARPTDIGKRNLDELQNNYDLALRDIRQYDAEWDPDRPFAGATFNDIADTLPDDGSRAFIQFFVSIERSFAFVCHRRHVFAVPLPGFGTVVAHQWIVRWLETYYQVETEKHLEAGLAEAARVAERRDARDFLRCAGPLWREELPDRIANEMVALVIEPVWKAMEERGLVGAEGPVRSVLLSPHNVLHVFPLHAAPVSRDPGAGRFGDLVEVTYTPSFALHQKAVRSKVDNVGEMKAVIAGDPRHDLRAARAEAAAVGRLWIDAGLDPTSLLGSEATAEAIVGAASEASRLHYCGHAGYNLFEPLESALLLAQGERLTLRDIYTRVRQVGGPMNTVFGCEVAMLLPNATDEPANLATGLLFSGASCVIGTLWAVHDISAALFSHRFHACLLQGLTPAAANRETQRWLRGDSSLEGSLRTREDGQTALKILLSALDGRPDAQSLTEECVAMYLESTRSLPPDVPPFEHPYHWAAYVVIGA